MPAYHKKEKESNRISEQKSSLLQLTPSDLKEVVKNRFASFCTAIGIQALLLERP